MDLSRIPLYQIVVIIVAGTMLYQGFAAYWKHQTGQTGLKLLIRVLVWGGMILVAVFPGVTTVMARVIGLEGNINAVIMTGFVLGFLMIFKLLSAIERLEQNITKLVREDALHDLKPKS